MSATQYYSTIEKAYLAYYGRSSDTAGLAYWSAQLNQAKGSMSAIVDAFANSAESQALYAGLDNAGKIDKIYQQLFGRHADDGGLNYYKDQLTSGKMTIGSIMLNVADGATGSDATTITNTINQHLNSLDQTQLNTLEQQYESTLIQNSTANPAYGLYVTFGDAAMKWQAGFGPVAVGDLESTIQNNVSTSGNQETIKGLVTFTVQSNQTVKVDFADPTFHDWQVSASVFQDAMTQLANDPVIQKYAYGVTADQYQQGMQELTSHFNGLYQQLPSYTDYWLS